MITATASGFFKLIMCCSYARVQFMVLLAEFSCFCTWQAVLNILVTSEEEAH
jgi:hypothetical protein